MRRSPRASALAFLAALTCAAPLRAQVEPLTEQIRLSRQRLGQIREDQRRLRAEMTELAARVHDAQAELDNLDDQVKNQEALLRELDNQLAIRDQQVLMTTADLLRTQDKLVEKKVLFARRARDLYKRGPLANVHVLLAAESFAELINRYQYLYLVALHDRLLVRQIEELQSQLAKQQAALRREVEGLRDVRNDKVRELQDLYGLERQRNRRLTAFRGLRATAARKLEELQRDERELTGLVDRLEREREAAEALKAAAATRGRLTRADLGTLDWPVEGRVIYGYGRQRNDDGTVILRHGIGIAASERAPVHAVQSGTVVFAEPYLGYGPSIILSHGGGYYSLYLYLSDLLVAQGETVSKGRVIGRVGGADTPEGVHLEFQIRERGRAVDPLPWLRKSSG